MKKIQIPVLGGAGAGQTVLLQSMILELYKFSKFDEDLDFDVVINDTLYNFGIDIDRIPNKYQYLFKENVQERVNAIKSVSRKIELTDGYYNIREIYKPTVPVQDGTLLVIRFSLKKTGKIKRDLVQVTLFDYPWDYINKNRESKNSDRQTLIDKWWKKFASSILRRRMKHVPLVGQLGKIEREVHGGNDIAGLIKVIPTHSDNETYAKILHNELNLFNNLFSHSIIERLKITDVPIVFALSNIDSYVHNLNNYKDKCDLKEECQCSENLKESCGRHLDRVIGLAEENLLRNLKEFARIKGHPGEKFIVPTAGFSRQYITRAFGNMDNQEEVQRITRSTKEGMEIKADAKIQPWNTLAVLLLLIDKYLKKEKDKEGSQAVSELLSKYLDMKSEY